MASAQDVLAFEVLNLTQCDALVHVAAQPQLVLLSFSLLGGVGNTWDDFEKPSCFLHSGLPFQERRGIMSEKEAAYATKYRFRCDTQAL